MAKILHDITRQHCLVCEMKNKAVNKATSYSRVSAVHWQTSPEGSSDWGCEDSALIREDKGEKRETSHDSAEPHMALRSKICLCWVTFQPTSIKPKYNNDTVGATCPGYHRAFGQRQLGPAPSVREAVMERDRWIITFNFLKNRDGPRTKRGHRGHINQWQRGFRKY